MNLYKIVKYQKLNFELWNSFVSSAKNATFLFDRSFMEYHSDRFEDYSLLVFDTDASGEKLVAVLPANRVEDTVFSHQGLTYGGLVFSEKTKLKEVILMMKEILHFLNNNEIEKLILKQFPPFYCSHFSDELDYISFLVNAKLLQRDSLSVIDLTKPYFISKTRKESINRGKKNGLIIKEEAKFELFWNEILVPNLDKKHALKPVHTFQEMELLQSRFPENIRHFNVYDNNKIVAGTTVFINNHVVHPQYISGNENKNSLGSLDYLYHYLISDFFKDKKIFDFNNSNENKGTKLNDGLHFWKESFGAQTVTQSFYEIQTANYVLLENVLI